MTKHRAASLGLLFLFVLGVGLYFGLRWLIQLFAGMDPQVAKVTGVVCGTLLLSALVIASGIRAVRGGDAVARQQMQKAEFYRDFIETWSKMLRRAEYDDPTGDEEFESELAFLEKRLILLASPGVMKHYIASHARRGGQHRDNPETRRHVAQTLLEMRKDLGRNNLGIDDEKLLDLLVGGGSNDHLAASKKRQGW